MIIEDNPLATDASPISTAAIPRSWDPKAVAANYALPIAFLLLIIFFATQADTFLTFSNAQNIMRQSSITGIAAVGITLLFIGGGLDISQGAVMSVTGLLVVLLVNWGWPVAVVIVVTLLFGLCLGAINALFAERIGIPALIATLGTALVIRGLGFVATEGRSSAIDREHVSSIEWIGRSNVFGIPTPFVIAGSLVLAMSVALRYTVWGRHTYAIGGSQDSASAVGINASRHRRHLYAIAGLTSALAGLVLTGRLTSAAPSNVPNAEFDVITAAVLGGVSIYGGTGRVGKVLLAALFVAALSNGLVQLNVPAFWERVVTGTVFLLALSLDRLTARSNG